MSLAHKLYDIGKLITKEEIKQCIKKELDDKEKTIDYRTIAINFDFDKNNNLKNNQPTISNNAFEDLFFTKKIGGSGAGPYYLYPNLNLQDESDLIKIFQRFQFTLQNSILKLLQDNQNELKLKVNQIFQYIKEYNKGQDILKLKQYEKDNYILILTIDSQPFNKIMPQIWDNYYNNIARPHDTKLLIENNDFITGEKIECGYNPDVKFFTFDNYHDSMKHQIVNKLPMSKATANYIKRAWIFVIKHLKFWHQGLEYIILPSMLSYDEEIFKQFIKYLRDSNKIENVASKEGTFIRCLNEQLENFDKNSINSFSLTILFTTVDLTNLSVVIYSTLEDVLYSRIKYVVDKIKEFQVCDLPYHPKEDSSTEYNTYLCNYFHRLGLYARTTKSKGMNNKIREEKIYLAKLLLGNHKIKYLDVLRKFEFHKEYDYEYKKNLDEEGIKVWIRFSHKYVKEENFILDFLKQIKSIEV